MAVSARVRTASASTSPATVTEGADTGAEGEALPVEDDVASNGIGEPVDEGGDVEGTSFATTQHDELVTSDATDQVGAPHCATDAGGGHAKQFVAGRVAEVVVDVLEVVEIDVDRGHLLAGRQRVLEGSDDGGAIGATGQCIVAGTMLELGPQTAALGDVAGAHDDPIGAAVVARHRPKRQLAPALVEIVHHVDFEMAGASLEGLVECNLYAAAVVLSHAEHQGLEGVDRPEKGDEQLVRIDDRPVSPHVADTDRQSVRQPTEQPLPIAHGLELRHLIGDVDELRQDATELRIFEPVVVRDLDPDVMAVSVTMSDLEASGSGSRTHLHPTLDGALGVFGVDEVDGASTDEVFGLPSEDGLGTAVDLEDHGDGVALEVGDAARALTHRFHPGTKSLRIPGDDDDVDAVVSTNVEEMHRRRVLGIGEQVHLERHQRFGGRPRPGVDHQQLVRGDDHLDPGSTLTTEACVPGDGQGLRNRHQAPVRSEGGNHGGGVLLQPRSHRPLGHPWLHRLSDVQARG